MIARRSRPPEMMGLCCSGLARTISSVAAGAELCISYLDLVDAPLREVG